MHMPEPLTAEEMKFHELSKAMQDATDFAARKESAARIQNIFQEARFNRDEITLPTEAYDLAITAYLKQAALTDEQEEQGFFLNCANQILAGEIEDFRQHDLTQAVLAALPLLKPVLMADRHRQKLLENIVSVALPLPQVVRDGQVRDALQVFTMDANAAFSKAKGSPKAYNLQAAAYLGELLEGGANVMTPVDPTLN